MPSELLINLCKIEKVLPHGNADRLELAHIGGWQVVVQKGKHTRGDTVVYFPPDSLIPTDLADHLGVTEYLSIRVYPEGTYGRVKAVRLRGEVSHGFVANMSYFEDRQDFPKLLGANVAELLGVKKWEPEVKAQKGQSNNKGMAPEVAVFPKYTDIQNLRHYPTLFDPDDIVVITEKIHGTNSRVSICLNPYYRWWNPLSWGKKFVHMVGSHNVRRKLAYAGIYAIPLTREVKKMLQYLREKRKADSVVVYSEVYGGNIQDLRYGEDTPAYRVFDIKIDGTYLNWSTVAAVCTQWNVPTVPLVYEGKYVSIDKIRLYANGDTLLMDSNPHIREGIVVKTGVESTDPRLGRKILKYVSDDYLTRKGGTEDH